MTALAMLALMFCFDQGPDCRGIPESDPLHYEIQTARLAPAAPYSCMLCDEQGNNCIAATCPGIPTLSPFSVALAFDALAGPSICSQWEPPAPAVGEAVVVRVVAKDAAGNKSGEACP